MPTAKLFRNGNSQAVRLPKEFRMSGEMVKISRKGKQIIIEPLEMTWEALFESLHDFPDDFMQEGREQPPMQKREFF